MLFFKNKDSLIYKLNNVLKVIDYLNRLKSLELTDKLNELNTIIVKMDNILEDDYISKKLIDRNKEYNKTLNAFYNRINEKIKNYFTISINHLNSNNYNIFDVDNEDILRFNRLLEIIYDTPTTTIKYLRIYDYETIKTVINKLIKHFTEKKPTEQEILNSLNKSNEMIDDLINNSSDNIYHDKYTDKTYSSLGITPNQNKTGGKNKTNKINKTNKTSNKKSNKNTNKKTNKKGGNKKRSTIKKNQQPRRKKVKTAKFTLFPSM
jgi:hypothetical protein